MGLGVVAGEVENNMRTKLIPGSFARGARANTADRHAHTAKRSGAQPATSRPYFLLVAIYCNLNIMVGTVAAAKVGPGWRPLVVQPRSGRRMCRREARSTASPVPVAPAMGASGWDDLIVELNTRSDLRRRAGRGYRA